MIEQLKYINYLNEVFEFGKDGIFVDTNELHDFEWNVTKRDNRIGSLNAKITKKKLPVKIICETEEKGIQARNRLFEVAEKDALAMQYGKIVVGNYYMRCFVTKSKKKDYLTTRRYMKAELTITTDYPYWIKETTSIFRKLGEGGGGVKQLDFPYDHPFDYMGEAANENLINTALTDTNFKMIIYGVCIDPAIYIAGHCYQVNCTVGAGEYLTIDSVTKKIFITDIKGQVINKFNERSRESYIFQKIPPGNNNIAWEGSFGVDVVLLEERSEPVWI